MNPIVFLLLLTVLLGVGCVVLIWLVRRSAHDGCLRPILDGASNWRRSIKLDRYRKPGRVLLELALIVAWAMWVGREYLVPNSHLWPIGGEYGLSTQSYFVWSNVARCGLCVMWNGGINGGAPAFVELQGAVLHPLVVLSSLLFGIINGSKIVLIGSLATAGIAQWWVAKVLNLGWLARFWSAGLAVVGGHLAGRMEHGVSGILISTAACSLILAPLLKLALTGTRRAAVQLGIVSALAMLSGQGYLQIGVVLCYLPAAFVLLTGGMRGLKRFSKEMLIAGGLAMLLAAVFLVPFVHFWPNFGKDMDPYMASAQSFEYVPLNLVIRDMSFYRNESLHKTAIPYMYTSYIGWVPVILAILALRWIPSASRRLLFFFGLAIGLAFFVSSAVPLRFLIGLGASSIAGIRFPSFIAGLAVPPVLALSAWGVDLLSKQTWPNLSITLSTNPNNPLAWCLNTKWLVLAVPLLWALQSAYEFSAPWLGTLTGDTHTTPVLAAMKGPTTQWTGLPFGEAFWTPAVLDAGLKLSPTFEPWHWKDRRPPAAYMAGTRDKVPTDTANFVALVDGLYVTRHPENEYAAIETGGASRPCRATAVGGDIDVDCLSDVDGTLIVRENSWTGWTVTRDGQPVELGPEPWLNVAAPAGQHHYEFRYRPWDVAIGLLLSLSGLALAGWLWFRSPIADSTQAAL